MKRVARVLGCLLALSLVVGLMPATATAATAQRTAIQLVDATQNPTGGIVGWTEAGGYDYIYYGTWDNSAIKWRVLDDQTNTEASGLFLLSDVLLGTGALGDVYFDNTSRGSNEWQGSEAQAWCKNFEVNQFTAAERNAVLATTKDDYAFTSSTYSVSFSASTKILNGDRVFFLSAEEAENTDYGFVNDDARVANYGVSEGGWWLRSPSAFYNDFSGVVLPYGEVSNYGVNDVWAARPAFNVNPNAVLFTSAASGDGTSDGFATGKIFEIQTTTTSEWKLTLRDSNRNFSVEQTAVQGKAGDTITLNYSGATTGTNEYISVIIADSTGAAKYYGRIAQPTDPNGSVSMKIPASLTAGTYTLHVFSEQCNGDKMTDYASEFKSVQLILEPQKIPNLPQTGDNSQIGLWVAMCLLSMTGILLLRKKPCSR